MDDLVVFLRARLEEDEHAARAAMSGSGRWSWGHGFGELCGDAECPYGELTEEPPPGAAHAGTVLMQVHGYDVKEPWQGAAHIARHDPARVLAEVVAKRKILSVHLRYLDGRGTSRCRLCQGPGGIATDDQVVGLMEPWPCPTVRTLLEVYRDHPDFQPTWLDVKEPVQGWPWQPWEQK